jgi:hypothetical protein
VAAGVPAVLNLARWVVTVPEGASLRMVDLASELQILSFYQQRRLTSSPSATSTTSSPATATPAEPADARSAG